jgi:hypothetical protein
VQNPTFDGCSCCPHALASCFLAHPGRIKFPSQLLLPV